MVPSGLMTPTLKITAVLSGGTLNDAARSSLSPTKESHLSSFKSTVKGESSKNLLLWYEAAEREYHGCSSRVHCNTYEEGQPDLSDFVCGVSS